MGRSYSDKIKSRNQTRSREKREDPKKESGKKEGERFPFAPVIVVVVVIALLISALIMYKIQSSYDGDNNFGDGGGNGYDNPLDDGPKYMDVSLESLDNGIIDLSDYKGRVVIIDMFATWCEPCQYQMEELLEVQNSFSTSDVVILSIDTDLRETVQDVRSFRADYPGAKWPFAVSNQEFNNYFPASNIPTMYILDKDGEIKETHVGLTSASKIASDVGKYI